MTAGTARPCIVSVCIGTHDRADVLRRALDGLVEQTRAPDEVIVSDSSPNARGQELVAGYAARMPATRVRWLASDRRALPWHRWHAASAAAGEVVLFLDDDVRLAPEAIARLLAAYARLTVERHEAPAGIGFALVFDGEERPDRDVGSLRERWLGIVGAPSGTRTGGGIDIALGGLRHAEPLPVHQLWGGAMSFRREVLARVGRLDHLIALYERRIGRAEDVVLSAEAARHGALYLITDALALHPRDGAVHTPYARGGWSLGLTQTWGRAHTLRWLAASAGAYRRDLTRVLTLELARSAVSVARRPWHVDAWERMAGALCGTALAVARPTAIPPSPRAGAQPAGGP